MTTALTTQEATLVYETPDSSALALEASNAYATAEFLIVDNEETMNLATFEMNACNKRLKELDALRKSITRPMDEAKKAVMALFNPSTEKYKATIALYKANIGAFLEAQERKAAEALAKAEAEAAEQRKALEMAAELAENESEREAIAACAASIVASAPTITAKPTGTVIQKKWKAEVKDLGALLHYVADHPELHECIDIKISILNRLLAETGGAVEIPGVVAHKDVIVACKA